MTHVIREQPHPTDERNPVTLIFSLIKPKQARLVAEKATELGVSAIQPVVSRRVQQRGSIVEKDLEKLRAVAVEAAEQSERLTVPTVGGVSSIKDALEVIDDLFVCEERSGTALPILKAFSDFSQVQHPPGDIR